MEKMECAKVPRGVRKAKKKPVRDELDRIKQAEKKKRRLEKALANSAAIRSELEKKKQKKIEEQQRLDEEGAAIAEAVALNVLLDEDSGESCKFMIEQDEGLNNLCDSISNIEFIGQMRLARPYRNFPEHEIEPIGWAPNVYGNWNEWGNGHSSVLSGPFGQSIFIPCSERTSADLIVAQAVASLQIAEDAHFGSHRFDSVLQG